MFSNSFNYRQKLIELWFMAGLSPNVIDNLKINPLIEKLDPEILIQYPKNSTLLSTGHLPVSFKLF